jgi:hypothetical protein
MSIIDLIQTFTLACIAATLLINHFRLKMTENDIDDCYDIVYLLREKDREKNNILYDMIKTDLRRMKFKISRIKTKSKS